MRFQQPGSMCRNARIVSILVVLFLVSAVYPVSAHSAAEMGIAPDQYDKGIPVYWPYHALLMSTASILLLAGFLVMHFGKKPDRFRTHRMLQTAGAGSAIAGLGVAAGMISLSAAPHIRYTHDQIGAAIMLLIALTLILGYSISRFPVTAKTRRTHRWIGWTSVSLMVINILLGISMMAVVLAQ